ncbi:EAL domain-containing protein [Vibrio maritimus]|uniref:EAL domain-containing protein n=1 Tax=Vibrio maritimus TaxID=990268 RepID=UPI001F33EF55|nr:EAL domain-containing protein [Vibrio maritimus]
MTIIYDTSFIDVNLAGQKIFPTNLNDNEDTTQKLEILSRPLSGRNIQHLVNNLEQNGLGYRIDTNVLSQIAINTNLQNSHLFINLTNSSLHKININNIISKLDNIKGIVTLEISESYHGWRHDECLNSIMLLKELGYSIAIDDFSNNYKFSLDELNQIKPDYIKIDKDCFTTLSEKRLQHLIATLRKHVTESNILIEGVSSKHLLDKAAFVGANYIQGYFLHTPELISSPVKLEIF